ncbi:MAG: DNA-deoxyinosine glycosylase [Bacillota bacterium]
MVKEKNAIKHKFEPVINKNSKMLILGSFPSLKSREEDFFYMHPQNRFWLVLSRLFNDLAFLSKDIDLKTKTLEKHHIALYDVIESCNIKNSADASITNVKPTNVKELIKDTNILHIFLNGRKAYNIFKKYNPELKSIAKYLPSTSPANAKYRLEDLLNHWQVITKL